MEFSQFIVMSFALVMAIILIGFIYVKMLLQTNNVDDFEEYKIHQQELKELFKNRVK